MVEYLVTSLVLFNFHNMSTRRIELVFLKTRHLGMILSHTPLCSAPKRFPQKQTAKKWRNKNTQKNVARMNDDDAHARKRASNLPKQQNCPTTATAADEKATFRVLAAQAD